ncbi:ABC transporter ATP-binding protein [Vagococcus salmoninarum]|uniref:ABC transporter ATP-binding protein n=1 Tax=Vagococcus salmoninarum TaxID=2739 RepID=UPI0018800BF9|nr:ABC transporter ATP-binding protein [Vagococcus salmoninarum]MBE9389416.1 ABC transporter ATP-binding protein [Vagococcus salmoninarum]
MAIITVKDLTVDYGQQQGVFNLSFNVEKGQVMGFLGPNGAGKTTTIRQLLGFAKPDSGECQVFGLDPFTDTAKIQQRVGYLPGEPAFIPNLTGYDFIKLVSELNGLPDMTRAHELLAYFELSAKTKISKMSKGMKQKVGLVCAFMGDYELIILDEPTSGLDPLMQNKFLQLIAEEKAKGRTILMSSHLFEEIERTCDQAIILRKGHLVAVEDIQALKAQKQQQFTITFQESQEANSFLANHEGSQQLSPTQVSLTLQGAVDPLIKELSHFKINQLAIQEQHLEDLFMHFYGGENQ